MSIFIKDEKDKSQENQQDSNILKKDTSVDIMEMGNTQPSVVGVVPTKDIFGNVIKNNGIPVEERRDIFGDLIEQKPVVKMDPKKGQKGSQFLNDDDSEEAFKNAFQVDELESSFTDLLQSSKNVHQDENGLHIEMENGHTLDWIRELEDIGEFIGITDPNTIAQFNEHDARAIVLAAKAHGWDSVIPIATENEHKEIISREAQREGITIANMAETKNDRFSVDETVNNLEDFLGERRIGENFRDWIKRREKENKNSLSRESIKDFFYEQLRELDNARIETLRTSFLNNGYLLDTDGNKIHSAEEAYDMFDRKYGVSIPKMGQAIDTSLDNWLGEMIQKTESTDPGLAEGLKRVRENLRNPANLQTPSNTDQGFDSKFANLVQDAPAGIQESAYAAALLKEKVSIDTNKNTFKNESKTPTLEGPVFDPTHIA